MEYKEKVSVVLSCIDYRFSPEALPLLEEKFGQFDLIELAGGSKNLSSPSQEADRETVVENIGISIKLHGAKTLILTNHIDCGAYGGSDKFSTIEDEIDFHKAELEKAAKYAKKAFPNLKIVRLILHKKANGDIELI